MATPETSMPPHHQNITNRFIAACQSDERVLAAFLSGSYARGAADAYSDLDFGLITADEAYDDFLAERVAFIRQLGEPIFLEDYQGEGRTFLFAIFPDGTEVELGLGRESHFTDLYSGPYKVLLDKKGILAEAVFTWHEPPQAEQMETLHGLIYWFWHNLSHHFINPLARGQLWSAYGALEDLRRACIDIARLRQDFSMRAEGYERLEQAVPVEQLSPLQPTFCPMEREAMLRAALIIVRFYRNTVPSLAQAHNIPYPAELAQVISGQLERLCHASGVDVSGLLESASG